MYRTQRQPKSGLTISAMPCRAVCPYLWNEPSELRQWLCYNENYKHWLWPWQISEYTQRQSDLFTSKCDKLYTDATILSEASLAMWQDCDQKAALALHLTAFTTPPCLPRQECEVNGVSLFVCPLVLSRKHMFKFRQIFRARGHWAVTVA